MPHRPFRFVQSGDFHLELPLGGVAEVPEHLRDVFLIRPTRRPNASSTRSWPRRPIS